MKNVIFTDSRQYGWLLDVKPKMNVSNRQAKFFVVEVRTWLLISCPECGHQISTEAQSCPQCGHPNRSAPPTQEGPKCYACSSLATTRCQMCGKLSCVQHVDSSGYWGGYRLQCEGCALSTLQSVDRHHGYTNNLSRLLEALPREASIFIDSIIPLNRAKKRKHLKLIFSFIWQRLHHVRYPPSRMHQEFRPRTLAQLIVVGSGWTYFRVSEKPDWLNIEPARQDDNIVLELKSGLPRRGWSFGAKSSKRIG